VCLTLAMELISETALARLHSSFVSGRGLKFERSAREKRIDAVLEYSLNAFVLYL
jgi:hypothetical protein